MAICLEGSRYVINYKSQICSLALTRAAGLIISLSIQSTSFISFSSEVFCEELRDIPNGRVIANSRETGAVATYTCSPGYALEGSSQRTCGGTGVWSEEEPTCLRE